jgi:CRISPR/Cas system CSM-associated protein Csm2 small subunit
MSAAAFAYVLVLRGGEAKNELTTLLSEDRRADVHAALETVKDLPKEQIRTLLRNLRDDQLNRQRENAKKRIDLQVDRVSPKLYAWLARPF